MNSQVCLDYLKEISILVIFVKDKLGKFHLRNGKPSYYHFYQNILEKQIEKYI